MPLVAMCRRALRLVLACLVLSAWTVGAAAEAAVDIDGDGRHDRLTVERSEPFAIRIWLSQSGASHVIRTCAPVVAVTAVDLDGDHRPELVASDSRSRIHVWKRTRASFHSYRPRPVVPAIVVPQPGHGVEQEGHQPPGVIAPVSRWRLPLTLPSLPCASTLTLVEAAVPASRGAQVTVSVHRPSSPRPPPIDTRL